jgi:hypothetical protein
MKHVSFYIMKLEHFTGVLIAKKSIFENPIPNGGGGGSVFFVTEDSHRYLQVFSSEVPSLFVELRYDEFGFIFFQ